MMSSISLPRLRSLVWKEFLELRRNPGVFLPTLIMAGVALVVPFLVAIGIPSMTGDRLSDDDDLRRAMEAAVEEMGTRGALSLEGGVQLFLFQQFLLLFILVPVAGAMSIAAHSVIGEKQARTLEPLLATPVSTLELLLSKVVSAALPPFLLELVAVVVYVAGVAALGADGVAAALLSTRTLLLVLLLGPLAMLVALQLAVLVSSRVNDPRSAQQIGVIVILPVLGVLVAQFAGVLWLGSAALLLGALGLLVLWMGLVALSVRLFERETILTRWR